MSKSVVLVNPPNEKIVLRDMYSSTISKGLYNWPCADLLTLSGILKNHFNVRLIDANTLGLSVEEAVRQIALLDPCAVIFSFGNSVKDQDYAFVKKLREALPAAKLCGTGGLLYHNAENELREHPEFDAVIMNFTTPDILKYLRGEFDGMNNMVFRDGDKIVKMPKNYYENQFSFPVPLHEHLPLGKYKLSHGRSNPLTTVLTAYGCPATCTFCVSGTINYRYRSAENVIEELDVVKKLGVREIFFRDNVFGAIKKEAAALMNKMVERKYDFSWVADTRANIVTEETAKLMKASGCHALHMGVESASTSTLKKYQKGIGVDQMRTPFKICKDNGIKTLGYFIIGLPGETLDDIKRTIDLAIELDCDYASFNAPIPIIGTPLREEALQKGWIDPDKSDRYDGSLKSVIHSDNLTVEQIWQMRNLAYQRFYLRPSFIWNKISGIRTAYEFTMMSTEFFRLLQQQNKTTQEFA